MKRVAAFFTGLGFAVSLAVGLATAGMAQDRVTGDTIRDRIRDRMEQKRLERVPRLGGNANVPGASPVYESIVIGGRVRTFMRYTPNRVLVAGKRAPVVFALHGAKNSADKLQAYLGMNAVADREGFIVVYPQGENNRWNDGRSPEEIAYGEFSDADDVGFLNSLADALVAQGVADPKREYVVGLSNGGVMALRLACDDNSRFSGYAPVIATMATNAIPKCRPKRPIPVVMINGTDDEFIRFDGEKSVAGMTGLAKPMAVAEHFAALGGCKTSNEQALPDADPADGTTVTLRTWAGCQPGAGVAFYAVKGGGHQAPSTGKAAGGVLLELYLGTRSHDIDTAEAAWSFFKSLGK